MKKLLNYILAIPLAFLLIIPCAFVDQHLWNWFVAPYFGLHYIKLWVVAGFGLLVMTNHGTADQVDVDEKTGIKRAGMTFVVHALAFILGWIIYHLMICKSIWN